MVDKDIIKIKYIDTKNQIADIFTKPIENNQFFKLKIYVNRLIMTKQDKRAKNICICLYLNAYIYLYYLSLI